MGSSTTTVVCKLMRDKRHSLMDTFSLRVVLNCHGETRRRVHAAT